MLLLLTLLMVHVGQVWALPPFTITPNPPIAGQSFTIAAATSDPRSWYLFSGFGCNNLDTTHVLSGYTYLGQTGGVLPTTLTVSGLLAGQYSIYESNTGSSCNLDFTVVPGSTGPPLHSLVPIYASAAFLEHHNYCTASPTHC